MTRTARCACPPGRCSTSAPRRRPWRPTAPPGRSTRPPGRRCWCRSAGTSPWPGPSPAAGWPVRVTDDHRGTGPDDEMVDIRGGGLATSEHHGPPLGPRRRASTTSSTPAPARPPPRPGARSASPPGPASTPTSPAPPRSCAGARAAGWLAARGLPARLVAPDGAVTRVAGWPEPRRSHGTRLVPHAGHAASSPSLLLTGVLTLGIATWGGVALGALPRFATLALHRSLARC